MKILSYREYKAREAAIHRQHDANLRMYQMFVHNENMMKRLRKQQSLRDRERSSFMSRAKTAIANIISRRREPNDSEGTGPRAKSLHRSGSNHSGDTYRSGGRQRNTQRGGKAMVEGRRGIRHQSR